MSSKQRDPNPNKNSLVREEFCKRRMEFLICRCFHSYQGIVIRVRVPLFASDDEPQNVKKDGPQIVKLSFWGLHRATKCQEIWATNSSTQLWGLGRARDVQER